MNNKMSSPSISKFLALFTAVVVWLYVTSSESILIEREIPLEIDLPKDVAASNLYPKKIKVRLKGARMFMGKLLKGQTLYKKFSLKDVQNRKEIAFSISSQDLLLPIGIELVQLSPSRIVLELDRRIFKEVPLKTDFLGELRPGKRFSKTSIRPSMVMISGPYSIMKKTAFVNTEKIDITKLSGKGVIPVSAKSSDERIFIENEEKFNFEYAVRAEWANIELNNVRIKYLSSHKNFKVETKFVKFLIQAPGGKLTSEERNSIYAIADIPVSGNGDFKVKLNSKLPEGVELLQIDPEYINVSLQ